jgi:3-isopropylmalate dehydratase small subunit
VSELGKDVIQRIRDTFETECLLADTEIILAEGAWCCGCEGENARWAVPDAEHPLKFAHCYLCGAGALVVLWGA